MLSDLLTSRYWAFCLSIALTYAITSTTWTLYFLRLILPANNCLNQWIAVSASECLWYPDIFFHPVCLPFLAHHQYGLMSLVSSFPLSPELLAEWGQKLPEHQEGIDGFGETSLDINREGGWATVNQRLVVLRSVGDGVKRRVHDADLKGMTAVRSPRP